MDEALAGALAAALGGDVKTARAVGGGDINLALKVSLADGRVAFVKSHPRPPARMFSIEARGLDWLREADALRIPRVLACRDESPAFLALEWVEPGRPSPEHDEALGRGLAQLHRFGATCFGLDHENYIAVLPQHNTAEDAWPTFYFEHRLLAQLRMAVDAGRAGSHMRHSFERLGVRMDELSGPPEPPARLHGDLWSGNAMVDDSGAPVLIDPAVYGGHREVDLAMMHLFGGFSPRCHAAYDEAHPLSAGHEERVALYQLYPLMVHVNLFGGGYASRVQSILDTLT